MMAAVSVESIVIAAEVAEALDAGRPVVAMESTIYSNLGLPSPRTAEALDRCCAAVRGAGATPAVTAVLGGRPVVGLAEAEVERVLAGSAKVAERDLPVAIAQRWEVGVTTVSASVALAAAVGIDVFATGGIGGVHRGSEVSGDVSADLGAIARFPVVTVSAGAKAFLDLPRTLEVLETLSVPVLGFLTDRFPAFYVRDSGQPVPHSVESPAEVAEVHVNRRAVGGGGTLVANPIPESAELDRDRIDAAIGRALDEAKAVGLTGPRVTPAVLAAIADATDGDSVPANLALAENNARVAAEIAVAIAELGST